MYLHTYVLPYPHDKNNTLQQIKVDTIISHENMATLDCKAICLISTTLEDGSEKVMRWLLDNPYITSA